MFQRVLQPLRGVPRRMLRRVIFFTSFNSTFNIVIERDCHGEISLKIVLRESEKTPLPKDADEKTPLVKGDEEKPPRPKEELVAWLHASYSSALLGQVDHEKNADGIVRVMQIRNCEVSKKYRNMGLGRVLVYTLLHGYPSLTTLVSPTPFASVGFWKTFGTIEGGDTLTLTVKPEDGFPKSDLNEGGTLASRRVFSKKRNVNDLD